MLVNMTFAGCSELCDKSRDCLGFNFFVNNSHCLGFNEIHESYNYSMTTSCMQSNNVLF